MRYLIDTHILIWHTEKDPRLPQATIEIIENPHNEVYVSKMSLFEICIKQSISKINSTKSPEDFQDVLIDNNFSVLDLQIIDLSNYLILPLIHRDPFDRILIAQAISNNLTIITHDKVFKEYNVNCII